MSTLLTLSPICAYIVLLLALLRKQNLNYNNDQQYFLANRSVGKRASVLSIMATETSVATIMVFPALGMSSGFSLAWLCLGYVLGRVLVARAYLPKLYAQDSLSIYDTVTSKKAFSSRILSGVYLLAKFISSGVRFFMASYALHQILGGSIALWCLFIALVCALYSIRGGLKAVIITDQVQAYVILGMGVLILTLLGKNHGLDVTQIQWINTDMVYNNALFSPAMLIGGIFVSIGSHATDQDILQRALATKNLRQAQSSMILSGFAAGLVIMMYLFIGVLLSKSGLVLDTKSPLTDFMQQLNQPLILGLFVVLLMAAAMSTLDSALNSTALIWKSLFQSSAKLHRLSAQSWSFISLLCLLLFALSFIVLQQYSDNFLSLAIGAMNYVNGALIGIFTVFLFKAKHINTASIVSAFILGFLSTYICTWILKPGLAWTWTIVASSSISACVCFIVGSFNQSSNKANTI